MDIFDLCLDMVDIPSGYVKIAVERSTISNGTIHYKWAMFNSYVSHYQRVKKAELDFRRNHVRESTVVNDF